MLRSALLRARSGAARGSVGHGRNRARRARDRARRRRCRRRPRRDDGRPGPRRRAGGRADSGGIALRRAPSGSASRAVGRARSRLSTRGRERRSGHAGAPKPHALVLFRETTIAGDFAGLGGVEGLGRWVELRSGRLPRECRPERCEVAAAARRRPVAGTSGSASPRGRARPRSRRASSSAISWLRPTTLSPTPR